MVLEDNAVVSKQSYLSWFFPGVNNLDSLCSFLVALDSSWQFWAAPSIGGAVLASPWEVLGR